MFPRNMRNMDQPRKPSLARRELLAAGIGLSVPALIAAKPSVAINTGVSPVNARDFGAIGDDRADDTASLQAALDAAASRGGAVLVPAGVYRTRTLTISSKVHLHGEGIEATILKLQNRTDDDLIRTRDFHLLSGGNTVGGPFNWSIRGLTLDGNRANISAGAGLRIYGWGYILGDLRIRQCADGGIWSEWSTKDPVWTKNGTETPGDSMEAQVVNLKVHDCGNGGVIFRGPHDSQFANCVIWNTTTHGFHIESSAHFSGVGCQLVNCHVWGGHEYGYKIDAGFVTLVNCMAEWAKKAQVHLNYSDATIVGGRYFGNPKASHIGIEIGTVGKEPVYGSSVDARMSDLHGGAFNFANEGGSGQIRALVYQRKGPAFLGVPSANTRFEIQVNGLEQGSVNRIPRGSLSWNGGSAIVRHLSETVEWSPSAIAPGKAVWTQVTVKRAAVGDTVTVGFSKPLPPGLMLTGVVSAPGVVAVTLFNATGEAFQPAAGVVRADCWVH